MNHCGLTAQTAATVIWISINKANEVCNEMGLDAISTPCTIAAAMELYEKGLITDEDCNGVPLKWGSKEAIVTWTEWMGLGSNPLAKLMADGSYRLCQHYGVPELSMSVKKQEIPAYDARAIQGIGITYATSNRGWLPCARLYDLSGSIGLAGTVRP